MVKGNEIRWYSTITIPVSELEESLSANMLIEILDQFPGWSEEYRSEEGDKTLSKTQLCLGHLKNEVIMVAWLSQVTLASDI